MFCIWMKQFVQQSKFWHPRLPNIILCFFKNDFVYEETPEDQKLAVWNYILKKHFVKPQYVPRQYKLWKTFVKNFKKEGEQFLVRCKKMTGSEVVQSLARFSEYVSDHWRMTWALESTDIFTTYKLPKLLQRELPKFSKERINDIAFILSTPLQLSFMGKERAEFLQIEIKWRETICKNVSLNKIPLRLQEEIYHLVQKYIWVISSYKEGKQLTPSHLWRQMRDECRRKSRREMIKELNILKTKVKRIRKEKAEMFRSLNLSKGTRAVFDLLEFFARWIDERKEAALRANLYLEAYAKEISKLLGRSIWEVKYMTQREIRDALMRKKKIASKILAARRSFSVFVVTRRNYETQENIFIGEEAQKLWDAMFRLQETKKIHGQVASAPVDKIKGRAQVVLDVAKQKFRAGNILVTTMTRPEFVPLLRKAKAIITDEGGITCHAAIISRERGIPCVIGTKIATKVLKDGDLVEVDARYGIVRKISA